MSASTPPPPPDRAHLRVWLSQVARHVFPSGTYQLLGDGIPGHAAIDGFTCDVRPLAPGEELLDVVVPLVPRQD